MKITHAVAEAMPAAFGLRGHLVRLTDELGNVGLGEASPLPNYSPDDIEGIPRTLNDVVTRLDHVDDSLDGIDTRVNAFAAALGPASRFAVETSLLAILAQRKNTTIARLLGGKESVRVPINGVIGTHGDVASWTKEATTLIERGIRVLKVKLGRSDSNFDREHVALCELRKNIPSNIELRLDANGSFGETSHEKLTALRDVNPSYVEEPTHGAALLALGKCDVPWAADESLLDRSHVDQFLESSCAVVILKPAILGGVLYARKIALRAHAKKMGVVVTHLFDGNVAHAAACELALSLDAPLACGLDQHSGLVAPSPYLKTPGFVSAP